MSKTSNAPQIRFKDFTDTWEQQKFMGCINNVVDYRGKTPKKLGMNWSSEGFLALSALNVKDGYIDFELDANYGNIELYNEWMKKDLSKGQVIFTTEAPMGNVAQIPDDSKYILSQRVIALEVVHEKITDDFLATLLKSPKVFDDLTSLATGGTAKGVSQRNLSKLLVKIPKNIEEQKKIAKFFCTLNKAITLHQRKYNQVVNLKKAMLEKMFPKDGSDIPEIRFKEFNMEDINAWKKKNFGDMVDFFSGLTYTPNDVKKEGTLVLRSSNVKNGEIVSADNVFVDPEVVNSKNVQIGDVIVVVRNGSRDLIGKHAQIKKDMPNTVIGAFMTGIRSERPDFISAILDTDIFDKEISKNMGATINQITGKMFIDMNFVIPSEEEQIKIGTFFRKLDDLIMLYYQKLQKLKHIKKAMLEKMFV